MIEDKYDDWNVEGNLPEIKTCPFCGGESILCDNGYEEPVIDGNGAYVDMDIFDGDIFWCECMEMIHTQSKEMFVLIVKNGL